MSMNFVTIDSYSKTVTVAATAVDMRDATSPSKYALDAIIFCPSSNTSDLLIGNRSRQAFTILKGQSVRLSTMMNRMSQSAKFVLGEIFIKAGTNNDTFQVMLIGQSVDDSDSG